MDKNEQDSMPNPTNQKNPHPLPTAEPTPR